MQSKNKFGRGQGMDDGKRNFNGLRWALIGCFAAVYAQGICATGRQAALQFPPEERGQLMAYWSAPNRYVVGQPSSSAKKGSWQVRLTPEGSQWLWNIYKGKKSAGTLAGTAMPAIPGAAGYEAWITRKIHHDRWQALQTARTNNGMVGGRPLPLADRDTPEIEPEQAGPAPECLVEALGEPPVFAEAVQPKQFTVTFEDAVITYEDHVRPGSPRYAYYRSQDGVASAGVPLRNVDPESFQRVLDQSGCDLSRAKVLKAVSQLEGGFDSVNTYDTGFVSVGFIQFASLREGAGSLGAMMAAYKAAEPQDFATNFHRYGVDVEQDGTLDVVDPACGYEFFGAEANAKIIGDKRLIAVFQRAGQKSEKFCAYQIKAALAQYYPCDDKLSVKTSDGVVLSGTVADVIRSEAGMATLFDRKVNTGNINCLSRTCGQIASAHHCQSLGDLARYERQIVNGLKYRTDFTQDLSLSQPAGTR